MNLELLPSKVVKELICNGMLEDPVYLKWAMDNRVGFDYFLKLSKDDVYKVFQSLTNPGVIFLRALKNHPEENEFITSKLPSLVLKQYLDDREVMGITLALQEDARIKIMKVIYDLKEKGELDHFDWKLPSVEVLSGTSHKVDKFGNYNQFYENGKLAVTGILEKGKRSGPWKYFYDDGSLYAVGVYVQGQKQDEWCTYYLNGNLKSCGVYVDDCKKGEWKEPDGDNNNKIINY